MSDNIAYRPMAPADIDATTYVRKAALEWLETEQGNPRREPWVPQRYPHFEHLLRTDADGAWVAVRKGTVVGYSIGFTRGDIWFLAQLFVQPEVHSQGMGRELLRLAMDAGRKRAARVFSVVSSTSPVAQSLYMQTGMFALGIGYRVKGPTETLLTLSPVEDGTRKLVVDCSGWQDRIADLDRAVYGGARGDDHGLYLADVWDLETYSFAVTRDGNLAGYGYAMGDGHLGPFAAYQPDDVPALLRMAGEWQKAHGVTESFGYFLTTNPTALGPLLRAGWRIESWTFLLATERFGQFDRYVPGGGLLF